MSYTNGLDKPTDYFNTVLYTSNNGSSPRTISGVGFQPDFVWVKNRDDANYNHVLNDSVRGLNKILSSDTNGAELAANHAAGYISSANSDGFVITAGSSNLSNYDTGTNKQVVWNWKESATAGFDIVSYTGNSSDGVTQQNISHSLSAVPQVIIIKNRTDATNWCVYHHKNTSAPETEIIYLNLTNATSDDSAFFGDTAPTSSIFTVGGDNGVNGNGDSMIAYCFSEVKSFSKFGSYVGNGNADGTFVYTGFRPAWVMIKSSSSAESWVIFDNKREGYNPQNDFLRADTTGVEANTTADIDLLSNGFKIRSAGSGHDNDSGQTYIYMAFAENPFVTSSSVPACAR